MSRRRALLTGLLLLAPAVRATEAGSEAPAARALAAFARLAREGRDESAAAYIEFQALAGRYESDLHNLRLLLLASLANSRSGDFQRARERLVEARRVFDWASPRSPLAADPRVRARAEAALELVEHDVLSALSADPVDEAIE